MKKVQLTDEQTETIKNELREIHDVGGNFDIDVELDDLTVNVSGWIELDGYTEDDYHCGYMNGTGAWVETHRDASVTIKVIDEYGNEHQVDRQTENEIYNYLNEE